MYGHKNQTVHLYSIFSSPGFSLLECHPCFYDPFSHVMLCWHHRRNPLLRPLLCLREVQPLICCRDHVLCFKWVIETLTNFFPPHATITINTVLFAYYSDVQKNLGLPANRCKFIYIFFLTLCPQYQLFLSCLQWQFTPGWLSTSWASASVTGVSLGPTY